MIEKFKNFKYKQIAIGAAAGILAICFMSAIAVQQIGRYDAKHQKEYSKFCIRSVNNDAMTLVLVFEDYCTASSTLFQIEKSGIKQ